MKNTVFVSALLATSILGATSAYATPYWPPYTPPTPPANPCATNLCDINFADFKQTLDGFQSAINLIVDVKDATDVVQKAVNAGNLITVVQENDNGDVSASLNIGLGTIVQDADLFQFALNKIDGGYHSDFTGVAQSATNVVNSVTGEVFNNTSQIAGNNQWAKNILLGGKGSAFYGLEQAATNVVNSVTATTVKKIEQTASTDQVAVNFILGGKGGYDADAVNWEDETAVDTQAAVNASNLINIDKLTLSIDQTSTNLQVASNTALFESALEYTWFGPKLHTPNVFDFGQSATNVTNSITVGVITPASCTCNVNGYEIEQTAVAGQVASNLLATMGNVTNAVQSATNVANSISIPTP